MQLSHSVQNKWTNSLCAFLSFILINTSAFDNINLLNNANDVNLNPKKLKPRPNGRNIVGQQLPKLLLGEVKEE